MIFILPIAAVVLGFLIALWFKPKVNAAIKLLLAFSGAFLLSITIFEFLPELYASGSKHVGLFIMAGLLFQILLEFLSRGAEHGHLHVDADSSKLPWLLFLSLAVHSILEGFPLYKNADLVLGISIHKIPIAIIISSFLIASNINTYKTLVFLIVFALLTPIGSYVSTFEFWTTEVTNYINAAVVGVLLHVSTTILFESSKNHQFNATKFGVILLGIALAYLL